MKRIFKPVLDEYDINFIDDIIVYSKDHQEQASHLAHVLKTLRWHKLYANFSKYSFWLDRISFLDHVVSSNGVSIDRSKVEAVVNWSQPTNVTEIRSLLGLPGYYHHFIEGFSRIAVCLTCLTKKGVVFYWDPNCEDSFVEIKRRLTSTLVLILLDNTSHF